MAKILIVDDSRTMRNILKGMLEQQGHEIVGNAVSGVEALKMYAELKPDLVTMDIQMADGDGMTCVEKIIALDPCAKVIMVSALGGDQNMDKAYSLGAMGYISKPFKSEELFEQTKKALAK